MSYQIKFNFENAACKREELIGLLTPDDIYLRADDLLDQLKEDKRIERKPVGIHAEPLGDYFGMWANTSPDGGLIVVGISDDGAVHGCESADSKQINRLENAGAEFSHGAQYEHKRIRMKRADGSDDWVMLFRVYYHPSRVVETVKRKVFVRRGASKIELKEDEERRQLRIDKGEVQFEQEPSGLIYPDDFDMSLINQLTESVRKIRGLDERTSDQRILSSLRMISKQGSRIIPNMACAILFAVDPVSAIPGCKIHFLRYEGATEKFGGEFNETANLPPIEGPLAKQIDQIDRILGHHIRKSQAVSQDGKFQDKPEYPKLAWLEAIVNACVHRSYNYRNRKTFVRMFDDRLEFESPGPFPPGITPETIYDVQHSRNPYIMEAMRYLGIVREIGEGTPRIRQEMLKMNLPGPEFSQSEIAGASVLVRLRKTKPESPKRPLSVGSLALSVGSGAQSVGSSALSVGSEFTDFCDIPEDVSSRLPQLGARMNRDLMRRAVLELCAWRPLMPSEIAHYVDRKAMRRLVEDYLSPMTGEGILERTIPDKPAHPGQRYRTTEDGLKILFVSGS